MSRAVTIPAIAGEDLDAGTFVELRDGRAFACPGLDRAGGVVRSLGGGRTSGGAPVTLLTDGGVLTRIPVTVTIRVRGQPCTLYGGENYYLRLSGGLPIGYDGDHRVIA